MPGVTRSYNNFTQAVDEAFNARIYGGIHFRFDNTAGQGIGISVGNYLMDHFTLPQKR